MMKIEPLKLIFLDIDGVLNSLRSFTAFKPYNPVDDLELESKATTDPVSVSLLNQIISKTNSKIVVSSSHRIYFNSRYSKDKSVEGFNLEKLRQYIGDLGICADIIDATPINDRGSRGQEIKDWMEHVFPTKFPQYALEHWVIIDDGEDMLPEQAAHFVKTTWENGLSIENFFMALTILGYSLAREHHDSRTDLSNGPRRTSE